MYLMQMPIWILQHNRCMATACSCPQCTLLSKYAEVITCSHESRTIHQEQQNPREQMSLADSPGQSTKRSQGVVKAFSCCERHIKLQALFCSQKVVCAAYSAAAKSGKGFHSQKYPRKPYLEGVFPRESIKSRCAGKRRAALQGRQERRGG